MKTPFFNLMVDVVSRPAFFEALTSAFAKREQTTVNFLNAHCFNVAQEDAAYREALNGSSFLLNDGVGVDIAARRIGVRFPENLNGTDLIPEILGHLQYQSRKTFFTDTVVVRRRLAAS